MNAPFVSATNVQYMETADTAWNDEGNGSASCSAGQSTFLEATGDVCNQMGRISS
jgi:hypothetical protein